MTHPKERRDAKGPAADDDRHRSANEDDFNRWYEEEHLDERMAIPGFINARRFTRWKGGPKYLALYDLESPEVLQSAPYRHIVGAGKSAWTRRMEDAVRQLPPQRLCRPERAEAVSVQGPFQPFTGPDSFPPTTTPAHFSII
jgi:hypothetical protein